MDSEDDTVPYLRYLTDNPGSYLLHNSYELQDALPVESILTDMENGAWPSECFPLILSGPTINEAETSETDVDGSIKQKSTEIDEVDSNEIFANTEYEPDSILKRREALSKKQAVSVPETAFGLMISQDSLSDLPDLSKQKYKEPKRSILWNANGNTYTIGYSLNESEEEIENENALEELEHTESGNENMSDSNEETIVLYPDPEIHDSNDLLMWQDFYSILTAIKCKICSFLCESTVEMSEHFNRLHSDLMEMKLAAEKKCPKTSCDVKMTSLLDGNHHFKDDHNEKSVFLFVCSLCSNVFPSKEVLVRHMFKVHDQIPEPDDFEKNGTSEEVQDETANRKTVSSMRNLATSLIQKQKKLMKKVKCSVKGCTLKFANNDSKIRHEECHVGDKKQYQCPVCKQKFSMWRICSKHLWTCHKIDAGLYSCPLCNAVKSNSPVVIVNHMDTHNSERPFICTVCKKGFKQKTQLMNHSQIHKSIEELPSWATTQQCTICERFFANSKSLKKHIQSVHEKFKPYICNICGHKTSRKAMLETHLRQHTGVKPYHCPHCTYKTGDHNCLRKHIMKHYGSKKYSCPYCKYQAIQSSAYKAHLASKHPDKEGTFKCSYCAYSSVNFESYMAHVKSHELSQRAENGKTENSNDNNGAVAEHQLNSPSARNKSNGVNYDETQIYLHLTDNEIQSEEIVDTGGITIPAGLEMQLAQ